MLGFSLTALACSSEATGDVARFDASGDETGPVEEAGPTTDATSADDREANRRDAARDASRPDTASDAAEEARDERADVLDAGRSNLCARLRDPLRPNAITMLAEQVDKEYVTRVYRDCSVAKMARTDLDTIFEFYNDLLLFSLDLWGCTDHPPTTFGLVRTSVTTELTSADAQRLVEHYVGAATTLLHLDTSEAAQLRQDLTRLSTLSITRPSDEFALSVCGVDASSDPDAPPDASDDGDAATDGGADASAPADASDDMGGPG